MLDVGVRGVKRLALVALAAAIGSSAASAACTPSADDPVSAPRAMPSGNLASRMKRYIDDSSVGRRALEESIVNRDNAYSALRLARYDDAHWGALPEFDPPTTPIALDEEGAPAAAPPLGDGAWSSLDAQASGTTLEELRSLGERAFFRFPLQTSSAMPRAVADADHAGIWEHEGRLGAVWVSLPNDIVGASFTCATCHASKIGDRLVAGRNNPDLDAARLYGAAAKGADWGLGRVDVTNDDVDNPVAITDLRPVRYQEDLHHAATLRNDAVALAVRIETLIITSHRESVRPPRKIAAALAVHLLSLAPTAPLPEGEGAPIFTRECGGCHGGEGANGPAVRIELVGTDPTVGASPDRGTGSYRVPSLRAVGDRRRLFASGAVDDIDALLDPKREAAGHRYGLALDARERGLLLAYLRRL